MIYGGGAKLARALGYEGIELGPEFLNRSVDDFEGALAGTGVVVSAIVGSLSLLDPDPAARSRAVALDEAFSSPIGSARRG